MMKMIKIDVRSFGLIAVFGLVFLIALFPVVLAVEPFGAGITAGTPQRSPADAAGTANAYAGNITDLVINGFSNTQSWQGYYGNVTGTIQLADASDNVLYNWTLANPSGEVYASTNSTITWTGIQCFNFTANATGSSGSAGGTNQAGLNLSVLEARFGILSDDVDGVNETFTLQDHDQFFTANLQFSANECRSTRVYNNGGSGVDQQFEEVLLYEPTTASLVFTSIIDENGNTGFNSVNSDFEMLVLEDGHGIDVAATTYNFFVELE